MQTLRMTVEVMEMLLGNPSPGCQDDGVEACVCEKDPYCCEGSGPTSVTASECLGCCGDNFCGPEKILAQWRTAPVINHLCLDAETDKCVGFCGRYLQRMSPATLPSECGVCEGGCCLAHETPGCIDQDAMDCVGALSPSCVMDEWTPLCRRSSRMRECGGECCTDNGSPGCGDEAIEDCVCRRSSCCDVGWDQTRRPGQ